MKKCMVLFVVFMGCIMQDIYAQDSLWAFNEAEFHNVQFEQNVVYGKGGGKDLYLDLFLPIKGNPPYSVIIFIHGGGWKYGRKEMYKKYGYHFAENGMVAASIDYRLSGDAAYPAAIEDSKCAIRWMRANAEKYRINPDKICIAGGSAGGHLVGLIATTSDVKKLEGSGGYAEYSSKPNLVIAFYGVFNFMRAADKQKYSVASGLVAEFLGGTINEIPDIYKEASPVTHLDSDTPPFLLFHSTGDTIVPYEQSVEFKEVLEKAGVPVEMSTTVGSVHGYANIPAYYSATLAQMDEFIDRYFNK